MLIKLTQPDGTKIVLHDMNIDIIDESITGNTRILYHSVDGPKYVVVQENIDTIVNKTEFSTCKGFFK